MDQYTILYSNHHDLPYINHHRFPGSVWITSQIFSMNDKRCFAGCGTQLNHAPFQALSGEHRWNIRDESLSHVFGGVVSSSENGATPWSLDGCFYFFFFDGKISNKNGWWLGKPSFCLWTDRFSSFLFIVSSMFFWRQKSMGWEWRGISLTSWWDKNGLNPGSVDDYEPNKVCKLQNPD